MKKVGIITYHFAQNYGAVLQCYALQTYLSQQGYAVTVFDFVSEKQQKNNDVVKHGASVKTAVANICLLPFTHSMAAMREAVGGVYDMNYWMDLGKLGMFLIVSLVVGLVLRRPIIRMNDGFTEKLEETKLI